jgi:hypothetical protein
MSMAAMMEALAKELKEHQERATQSLSLEIRNSVPKVLHGSITPSQASGAQSEDFFDLLSKLGLPRAPEQAPQVFTQQKDSRKNFSYDWPRLENIPENSSILSSAANLQENPATDGYTDSAERASYTPLCKYLCDLGFDAVVVGEGQGLPNKLLYNVYAYTMRDHKKVSGQQVHYIKRIHGRTDLVVLDNRGKCGEVTRERVKFAIEVKPAKVLKDQGSSVDGDVTKDAKISDDGVSRSVMTQLLGLNICNPYNAPPVLLTNLVRTHIVYHITEHEVSPWFRMACQRCSSFLAALQFIEGLVGKKRCTAEFGRPCSPDMET